MQLKAKIWEVYYCCFDLVFCFALWQWKTQSYIYLTQYRQFSFILFLYSNKLETLNDNGQGGKEKKRNTNNLKHNRELKLKGKEKWWGLKNEEAEGFKRLNILWERKERGRNLESPGSRRIPNQPESKREKKMGLSSPSSMGPDNICTYDYLYKLIFPEYTPSQNIVSYNDNHLFSLYDLSSFNRQAQQRGNFPREQAQEFKSCEEQASDRQSMTSTVFYWCSKFHVPLRIKGWGNRHHLLLREAARSHNEGLLIQNRNNDSNFCNQYTTSSHQSIKKLKLNCFLYLRLSQEL